MCELVWVLKSQADRFSKDKIINILEMMLQSTVFELENSSVLYEAIELTKQGSADFSDYLIGVIARRTGCVETVTFDRKLRGEVGFNCFIMIILVNALEKLQLCYSWQKLMLR